MKVLVTGDFAPAAASPCSCRRGNARDFDPSRGAPGRDGVYYGNGCNAKSIVMVWSAVTVAGCG